MGKIIYITKKLFGKIDWNAVKFTLLKIFKKTFQIKENGTNVKIDRKFIKEFIHSKYSLNSNSKIKKCEREYSCPYSGIN